MKGFRWVILAVGVAGLGLLLLSHWMHALGVVPYVVLLACPLMHLFHSHHRSHPGTIRDAPAGKETNI